MKYKVGDKVRIKSIDWYNKNKDPKHGYVDCGNEIGFYEDMADYCGKVMTISKIWDYCYDMEGHVGAWSDEMIEGLVKEEVDLISKFGEYSDNEPLDIPTMTTEFVKEHGLPCPEGYQFVDENGNVINATKIVLEKKTDKDMTENNTKVDMGEVSDGYHTFNELYEYRMLYNAALFNEFAKQGLYDVHKSRKHSDGEYPFGDSNWFIVMAELPTGQISNHYEMKDWDKFQIPEKPLANKWDEHSPRDVAERLTSFMNPKKEYPKTYEECCAELNNYPLENGVDGYKFELLSTFQNLIICRDAYWKIAGEEMGLGKPWELSIGTPIYYIYYNKTVSTIKNDYADDIQGNVILAFPTEGMRDAFYENFKELINECKELL